jgi:filamentous hemagglutinin family protein
VLGGAIAFSTNGASAQITPDSTLPNNSRVTPSSNTNIIEGGTRAGSNLFHSFQNFSVPTGSTAFFNNAQDIQNIISRVTGGSISNIDGLIRANGKANLFLINPNGIVFGPNASLNIGGSFLASTATSLKFANGSQFSATTAQSVPLLTISVPIGLQFGTNPGKVQVQGYGQGLRSTTELIDTTSGLRVQPNQTLALVGGDVSLEGATLKTAGGRIELGSVGDNSSVSLTPINKGFTLNYNAVQNFRNIQLSKQAAVDASGAGSGDIQIWGRRVTLTNGSQVEASTLGAEQGGNIVVNAQDSVQLIGTSADSQFPSGLFANVYPSATGAAGDLTINTGALLVRDGGQVSAGTLGQGNAGSINITTGSLEVKNGARLNASTSGRGDTGSVNILARDQVSFDGVGSNNLPSAALANVEENAVGKAGNVNITAGSLSVSNGAELESRTRGRGDAGSINILARDRVSFDGVGSNGWNSGAYSTVGSTKAVGNAGGINITTGSLEVKNGAQLQSLTRGRGDAGSVTIQASGPVSLGGVDSTGQSSFVSSTVESGAVGNGGSINIKAGSLSLTDGANIQTPVRGASDDSKLSPRSGNAGNVSIDVRDAVTIAGINKNIGYFGGILSSVSPGVVGDAGSINIKAGSFSLTDGGTLSADTLGQGKGGNINLDVKGAILLTGGSTAPDTKESTRITLGVLPGGIGSGGNLYIKASSLVMTDGAIVKDSTQGQGNAGNIYVDAGVVDISGNVPSNGLPSGLFTSTTTNGRAGDIIINTQTFRIADGAALSGRSKGEGQGGDIRVNATDSFEAVNGGQLVTTTFGQGQAGNIFVDATNYVTVSGSDLNYTNRIAKFPSPISSNVANAITETGAVSGLFANTEPNSIGWGGGIRITTRQLSVSNGSQISASTFGQGNAGNISFKIRNNLTLDGASSGLFANTTSGSTGNGGSIFIDPSSVTIQNGASIAVNSQGTGKGGNIQIQAGTLALDNKAFISAETASNTGGNIVLQDLNLLLLRRNSQISTTASAGGDGGNIDIGSKFIIAVPEENSDITANAFSGNGGKVRINATGIFGIAPISRKDLERLRPNDLDPRQLPTNDITAVSQQNPSLSGTVDLNTPNIDPNRGLVNLPAVPIDTQVAQGCTAGGRQAQSSFIVTGRGGLPPNPSEALNTDAVQVDLVTLNPEVVQPSTKVVSTSPTSPTSSPMVEATGWAMDNDGNVVLTANAAAVTSSSSWHKTADCSALDRQQGH